jgi:dipeptidyl aminopeptidase/acylaminoacyl peptidase
MASAFDIERFLNIRSCSGASFAPDGRTVSFLSNVTGVSQLWQVAVTGGWPTQLTFTSERVDEGTYNPRRHELIYRMDAGGNERAQLFLLRGVGNSDHGLGAGWTSVDLSQRPKAIHYFGGWNHEGNRFAFTANRVDPGRFDVFVQALAGREARLIQKGPGGFYLILGWSPDDRWLLLQHVESNFNQNLFLVEANTGQVRPLTPHKGEVQYRTAAWASAGQSIYCTTTAEGRDRIGLARIDLTSGKLRYLETPDHEVDLVQTSPAGRWLAWVLNAAGKSELHLRDLKTNKRFSAPGLPLGVVSELVFAPDDGRLAFTFNGPRHNSDVWLWDLKEGKDFRPAAALRQLTHAGRAGIPFDQLVEPDLITYQSFDGRMIPAWFYPPANKPRDGRLPPVIVYPHGGPESQTRATFNPIFQYLLQAGYAVLAPNVRGSTGYGVEYMNLDNTSKRLDSVKDLAHAAYWLRDKKKGDPKRLAVFGGSYGGFMVLAQVTGYPDLWAAGVDAVGIANFVTFLENTGDYRRSHREAEYGSLARDRAFLEKISPIHQVERIRCPMLVVHGANDPRVPIGEAEQIVAALKKRKVPVEYIRYEDEGHGLSKLKNRLDFYPKMVAFLDRYLK